MERQPFVPIPGVVPRNRSTIEIGDIVGVLRPNAKAGYIGIVDHIYKNASNHTYHIVRYADGTSESIFSGRFFDIDEVNHKLHAYMDNNSNAIEALRK